MKRAIFIIPYFGKLPYYFQIWMRCASVLKNFDFLIITDDYCKSISKNIIIQNMSFENFTKFVQNKFDFIIGLTNPRKLCDFKPTYGYLFEDYIKRYDYWGYCDIDVILGDLDKMVPLDIGYRKLFVHGHMTLIENNDYMNKLFMIPVDGYKSYKSILMLENNVVFDEMSDDLNINLIAHKNNIITYVDYNIADINPYSFLFRRSLYDYESFKKSGREIKYEPIQRQIFLWDHGRLDRYAINSDNQLVIDQMRYFHFQKRIMKIDHNILNSNRFMIVPNRIFDYSDSNIIDKDTIVNFTHNHVLYPQYYILKCKNLKKRLFKSK